MILKGKNHDTIFFQLSKRNRITFIDIVLIPPLKLDILLAEDEKDIITTFKMALEVRSH